MTTTTSTDSSSSLSYSSNEFIDIPLRDLEESQESQQAPPLQNREIRRCQGSAHYTFTFSCLGIISASIPCLKMGTKLQDLRLEILAYTCAYVAITALTIYHIVIKRIVEPYRH